VVRQFFERDNPASPAVRKGIEEALAWFRAEGAIMRDVSMSPLTAYSACTSVILLAEAYGIHEPWLNSDRETYGEIFRDRVSLGGLLRAADYVQANRRRRELCLEMRAALADLDLLVSAPQAGEAPRSEAVTKWSFLERPSLAAPACLTGYPSISVCSGFGTNGLPVGMQLIGKPFDEPTLFRAAHAYECAHAWSKTHPMLP
jgi:aspartyl-tRNA(Asn)/glutamyl-tRNA(Gln) amidotransferase subunit A